MSGVTRQLTRDQAAELREYTAGVPRRPARSPSKNLIRRGLLLADGGGLYRITPFGVDVLNKGER